MKKSLIFALITFFSLLFLAQFNDFAHSQPFTIGQKHRGGIIFYIDSTGIHGLIAASSDQGKTFGEMGRPETKNESGKIINPFNSNLSQEKLDDATIAKRVCSYFTTTVRDITYHTWYLPSVKELRLLYAQKDIVGGFTNGLYWSSTTNELKGGQFLLDFSNGDNMAFATFIIGYIRPIQAF